MQTLFHHGSDDVSTCRCSRCGHRLPSADINVSADTALCRTCGSTYKFSELVAGGRFLSFDPSHPPEGVSFVQGADGTRVSATTRSAEAWILIPFMCVWSGFSLTMIYGSQIRKGTFNLGESVFGIPFVLGTILFGAHAAMRACGRVTVAWKDGECTVFSGVGSLGWTRKFRWSSVQNIVEDDATYLGPSRGARYRVIRIDVLNGARLRSIKFGALLSGERRQFIHQCIFSVLRSQGGLHQ